LHSTAPPVHHGNAAPAGLGQVIFASHHHDRRGDRELGIGSDCDGISALPKGMENVSGYPALLFELMRRGRRREYIAKVAGLSILRVMNGRVPIPPCGFGRGALNRHRQIGNNLIDSIYLGRNLPPRQVDWGWLGAGNK